jgi:hypothetical protein
MADIIQFKDFRKPSTQNNTLCKNGHHKWIVDKAKQFDVKQGKLVTAYKCERCGATKNKLV